MFYSGILTLSILPDCYNVNVVIKSLYSGYAFARSDVCIQTEQFPECQVQGDMTLSDWSLKWTFVCEECCIPFNPILFLEMVSIAIFDIVVVPSGKIIGSTSTSSHSMGAYF